MTREEAGRVGFCLLLILISGCGNPGRSSEAGVPEVACMESPDTVGYRWLGLQEPTPAETLRRELTGGTDDTRPTSRAMTPVRRMRVAASGDPQSWGEHPPGAEFDAVVRGGLDEPVIGPVVQFVARETPALIMGNVLVLTVGSRIHLDRSWWAEECARPYRLTLLEEGVEVIPR